MEDIQNILKERFEFNLGFWRDGNTYILVIRRENNFNKWMELIGTNNPKNKKKYRYWLNL